jgi:carbon storage regulator
MLILKRKVTERIMIGDNIILTIVSAERGVVGVGVEAPKDVPVHREEIYNKIQSGKDHTSMA